LCDEVVEDIEGRMIAVAVDVSSSVVEDHEHGGDFGIVLGGDVDPVVALHAVVDVTGDGELW
jgi:hypothetical protein